MDTRGQALDPYDGVSLDILDDGGNVLDETLSNLSMNKDDGRYVETIVNQQSALVDAEDLEPAVLFAGYSVSGLVMDATAAASDVVGLLNANSNKI